MRNSEATTYGPHRRKKGYVGSFHYGLVHKPVFVQEAMKIPEAKSAVEEEWHELDTVPAWDVKKARPKSEVIRQAKKEWKNSPLREPDGTLTLGERRSCETPPEIQGASRAPQGQRQRRRRIQSNIHRARCFRVSDGSGKILGHYLKASLYGWRSK